MRYLPIIFHVVFISFTVLNSFFGPKIYQDYNKWPVFLFMMVYLFTVYWGFKIGFSKSLKTEKYKFVPNLEKITQTAILISVILILINSVYLFLSEKLSMDITQIGANYSNYYEYYYKKKDSSLFTFENIFLVLIAIPKFISTTLGFFYFKQLNKTTKRLFVALIILILVTQTLSLGNQKSIGDLVIFASVILLIKSTWYSLKLRRKLLKRIGVVFILLFTILSYTQFSRLNSRDIGYKELNDKMASYAKFDFEHPIFKVFGYQYGLGIATFTTGYLSNGYYGLSKMLEMEFDWSYGVGHSVALTSIIEKVTDEEIYEKTYLHRMEEEFNIPGKRHWHTIFPWFASDFTFFGTIIIFYFLSFIYGKCWREVLQFKNPFSILLFCLLTVLFMFVPANNQILHGFDYLLVTITVAWIWAKYHKRLNHN